MSFVLASGSPRRRELLAAAGFVCEVHPVDVDERRLSAESAEAYVARVAALKVEAGAASHPGRLVLAADTAVVVDEEIFGKPVDASDAVRMLTVLSGRDHRVLTAVAIESPRGGVAYVEGTRVWMAALTPGEIAWYVGTGEPMDKAGAYAVQGLASRFVTRIEGSYANVVGLPVASVALALARLGHEV